MKTIRSTSIACAGFSLLGLVGLSAMDVAPEGEAWHGGMALGIGAFLVGWIAVALWSNRKLRLSPAGALSSRAKTAVVSCGVVYIILMFLFTFG